MFPQSVILDIEMQFRDSRIKTTLPEGRYMWLIKFLIAHRTSLFQSSTVTAAYFKNLSADYRKSKYKINQMVEKDLKFAAFNLLVTSKTKISNAEIKYINTTTSSAFILQPSTM